MIKPPVTWSRVLEEEYRAIHGDALLEGDPALDDAAALEPEAAAARERARVLALHAGIHARAATHPTSAICLSGGGIRSSTFALGVLQGLASVGVLGKFDYLSTVSGGGYTGGWFTAWLRREGPENRDEVLRTMDPARPGAAGHRGNAAEDVSPVERLRRTCRFLAPRGGIVSADVWTLVATMTRNLVLNWFVILPLLAAALMIPRIYYGGVQAVEHAFVDTSLQNAAGACDGVQGDAAHWTFLIALLAFLVASTYAALSLVGLGGSWKQGRFLGLFLLPVVGGAVSITLYWSAAICPPPVAFTVIMASGISAAAWIVVGSIAQAVRRRTRDDGSAVRVRVGARTVLAAVASAPVLAGGMLWLGNFQYGFGPGEQMRQLYAVFAVPLVLVFGLAQMTVFVGLASTEMDDAVLEWYSRCGAWVAIAGVVWIAAGVLVFYLADLVEYGVGAASHVLNRRAATALVATSVPLLSSLAGMAGRSLGGRPWITRVALTLAFPAIIVVLLSTIAWADLRAAQAIEYHRLDTARLGPSAPAAAVDARCTPALYKQFVEDKAAGRNPCHTAGGGIGENTVLMIALVLFGLLMSRFVPVNRFSLNGMYRQRLIRTFLGASRRDRHPNGFTGFDAKDDVAVHELRDVRPLHVVCTTLNAVSATHVGRHETQAHSFTFSPLHIGNHNLGYRRSAEYQSETGTRSGVSLGLALAVSGAAISSQLGRMSSKPLAFLLTLANARLGVWFGNPNSATGWQHSEPPLGVGPVIRELLGLTTDHNPYVYLTDGGHYENLALWEMVARRCRFIVISDAGCDPQYSFEDLANAVRRIRLDLGIPIEFDSIDLTRAGQNRGNRHAAIGRIRYSAVDAGAQDGTILYLKATLSGDEPVDVQNFAFSDPTFPHDSTANQFFDEARFESYRTLGFHTVLSVAGGLKNIASVEQLCHTARNVLDDLEASKRAGVTVPVST